MCFVGQPTVERPMRYSQVFQQIRVGLLSRGHGMRFRATGSSMHPTIRDGEVIAVEFVEPRDVKRGDILLYRNTKRVLAHRVVAILNPRFSILDPLSSLDPPSSILTPSPHYSFILRGDASSTCDAPVESGHVLGRVVAVTRNRRSIVLKGARAKLMHDMRVYALGLARSGGINKIYRLVRRIVASLRTAAARPL